MQLSAPAPNPNGPLPVPTTRTEAAQALAGVPMAMSVVAMMTAMPRIAAGETASRADLVAPVLEKLTPATARELMLGAVEGSLALAPELADRAEALRQAVAGVATLLAECAADTVQQDAKDALAAVTGPLGPLTETLVDAAKVLDPNFAGVEPVRP